MRNTFFILTRAIFSLPLAILISIVLTSSFQLSPIVTVGVTIILSVTIYIGLGLYANKRLFKKHGLTRKEFNFILNNLMDARRKLSRLQSVFIRLRSIRSFKQMMELHRLVRRIFSIVKKEPKRFYDAEAFFYSHLDSVVELAEKYAWLNTQKIKDDAVQQALIETKDTLDDLSQTLEADLHKVLAKDIEHLSFELDVAKHSLQKQDVINETDERSTK